MNKQQALQAKLARSLDVANGREAKASPERMHRAMEKGWIRNLDARVNLTQATARQGTGRRPRLTPATGGKGAKLCISLFAVDLAHLETIRSYMAARGSHISTSQAVKLALRTARISEDLTAALVEIRKEDGRTK